MRLEIAKGCTPLIYIKGQQPTSRFELSSGPQPLYQIVVTVVPTQWYLLISPLANSCIAYLQGTAYEKPHCAINILYVAFLAFVMNCENQNPKFYQHKLQNKKNYWWKISTAHRTLQSLFFARGKGFWPLIYMNTVIIKTLGCNVSRKQILFMIS